MTEESEQGWEEESMAGERGSSSQETGMEGEPGEDEWSESGGRSGDYEMDEPRESSADEPGAPDREA